MKEEITNRYANATASREALERERESADPDRCAVIDAQLVTTRDTEQSVRRELDELDGFSGVPVVEPTAEIQQAQEQQAQQAQEPSTVRQKEYTSGNRFTGALGALKSERMAETHTHIDIVEARIANARTEQVTVPCATGPFYRPVARRCKQGRAVSSGRCFSCSKPRFCCCCRRSRKPPINGCLS